MIQVRGDGENTTFQIADKANSPQIPSSTESIDDKENTEKKNTYSKIKRKITTMETFKYEPSAMNEKLDWICTEIEKIKEFQVVVEANSQSWS